jgi:apolipoprotein D and lipocalin family protein
MTPPPTPPSTSTALQTLPPAPPPEREAKPQSLDERIRLAELALIEDERDVGQRWQALQSRVHNVTRAPQRFGTPLLAGLGGVGALAALWLALRDRRKVTTPLPAGNQPVPRHSGGDAKWVNLIALAWPLLPKHVRMSIKPTTIATVVSVGLPLLQRVVGGPTHPPLATMPFVNLHRFAGTWYEAARLASPFEGACEGRPSATYTPRRFGRLQVVNRCRGKDGRERVSVGAARVVEGSGNAKLEVSLWPAWLRFLPFAWADYWIVFVDDAYQVAVVGHPSRRFLWLLSRSRYLPRAHLDSLITVAAAQGFPVERLHIVT